MPAGQPEEVLSEISRSTDIDEILQCLVAQFEGPDGFARAVRQVYNDAVTGSATRARIVVSMLTAFQKHGSDDTGDEKLESELKVFQEKLYGNGPEN